MILWSYGIEDGPTYVSSFRGGEPDFKRFPGNFYIVFHENRYMHVVITGHWYYEQIWPVFVMLSHWDLLDRRTVHLVVTDKCWGSPKDSRNADGSARVR